MVDVVQFEEEDESAFVGLLQVEAAARSPGPVSWNDPRRSAYDDGMATVVLAATITCPECAFAKAETMPTNACQHFYTCAGCGQMLRPLAGDCCVFCSYADVRCPPKQAASAI